MQMNRKAFEEMIRRSVMSYAASIDVPEIDAGSIRARATRSSTARPPAGGMRRRAIAFAAVAVVLVLLLGAPAVIAQVQRIMRAFSVTNGQRVPLAVRTVSLEQARADMPFTVIPPAGIPAGFQATIRELGTGADARVMFQYGNGPHLPPLTIMESSAAKPDTHILIAESIGNRPLPSTLPIPPSGPGAQVQWNTKTAGGQVHQRTKITPLTWTQHGTRISILPAPSITTAEIDAIQAAMQR
jgi:hypothetical protein